MGNRTHAIVGLPDWIRQVRIKRRTYQYLIRMDGEWHDLMSVSDATGINRDTLAQRLARAVDGNIHMSVNDFVSTDYLRRDRSADSIAIRYLPSRKQDRQRNPFAGTIAQ